MTDLTKVTKSDQEDTLDNIDSTELSALVAAHMGDVAGGHADTGVFIDFTSQNHSHLSSPDYSDEE